MGLGAAELLHSVEEEFLITIPDDVARSLNTLGEIHDCIAELLQTPPSRPIDAGEVWKRLKRILIEQYAIPEHLIVPSARAAYDLGLD